MTFASSAGSKPTARLTTSRSSPPAPMTRGGIRSLQHGSTPVISHLCDKDAILVYSVGGGDAERNISANIVQAIDLAKARSAKVFGIVGPDSGYTAKHGDVVVLIPQVNPNWVTPLSEAFQAVVWHCLVSHPALQRRQTKW